MAWQPQDWLAFLALTIIGALSIALMIFKVPDGNVQLVTFALGAISGALTVGGAAKAHAMLSAPAPANDVAASTAAPEDLPRAA